MPKIRNFTLTPAMTEELVLAANDFPPDLILEWGRASLQGGFTKADLIRERMIARFRSSAALDPITLDMLSCEFPFRDTISALSLPALENLSIPCCILAGTKVWILSLLLDPRDEVHKFGVDLASKPLPAGEPTDDDIAFAEDRVTSFAEETLFWPFGIEPASPETSDLPPPPMPSLDELTGKLLDEARKEHIAKQERIDRLSAELHQQKQRHLAKLKEQSDAAEREKKDLRAQAAAAHEHEQQLLKKAQAAEARLADQAKHIESLVAQKVQEQTSALVRKWLEPALQLEAGNEASARASGELLQRASRLLEAQAQQDRHSRNRLELEGSLQQLTQARDRLSAALQTALRPLPELKPLLAEAEAEIEKIRSLLAPGKIRSDSTSRLLAAVNTAPNWDELRTLSRLLDELAETGLIPSSETREVYAAIQRKFSLFAETLKQKPEEPDTGWSLREVLFRNTPALLLLDGHNLLFNLADIFSPYYEEGFPRARARQRLVDVAKKLVVQRSNVQTKVCFDGPKSAAEKISPNLEVVYSGGTGANRADELIVANLQFKDLQSLDQKVFVVTDDREIRKNILQTGAKFVRNDLFALFLKDFGALQ